MDTVYIHIRHWLFWYGAYGLCDKSCNDEITIYSDKDKTGFLGYFEITTGVCLRYLLENEIDELEEVEFYNEVKHFLDGNEKIHYSYIYPRDKDDLEDQVRHFAPTNEKGYKPVYINMWTKLSDRMDLNEIKKCAKILIKEFVHQDVQNVEILGTPTYEETKLSYEEDYAPYV